LRRLKEDVEKSIAPKEETIIEVELTTIQKTYYRAVLERNFDHLASKGRANLPSLINIMMQLRKCCNHPFLLKGVEEQEIRGKLTPAEVNKVLIESSGKLVLIDKLLPKLKAGGHKVLIFSQMVRVLDILEDYLNYRGYKHERIDGSVRGNDRQGAIDRFSKKDSDIFVFLLCTRAGGVGINLTAADTVIIFDSDWFVKFEFLFPVNGVFFFKLRLQNNNRQDTMRRICQDAFSYICLIGIHKMIFKLKLDVIVLAKKRQ